MRQEKPIQQPYEAPQGYFDGFNARVIKKIEYSNDKKIGVKWFANRKLIYAVAATLALAFMGVGLYKVAQKTSMPENKVSNTLKNETAPVTVMAESNNIAEEIVIQQWAQEAVLQPEFAVAERSKNQEDISVEEELEAEGLIVRELDTEWLDENEILP